MQSLATRLSPFRPCRRACCALAWLFACVPTAVGAYDWQVEITPAGELFPALELSQAPHRTASVPGGGDGLVSVRIRGADIPPSLRLRIETPGLRSAALVDADAPRHGVDLVLHPRLDWDLDTLRHLGGTRRQVLHVTLQGAGHAREARSIELRLHPLDDALYFVREGKDRVDLGWSFAGYVNPDDPVVDEILALARALDPDFEASAMPHAGDADLRRVAAIWAALEQRGLRYADGDPALSHGPAIWSQRVRLLGDVWRERRASCIDGSVLIASVLERMGLHPFIALVPGHAFVGYGADRHTPVTLETTLLGAPPPRRGGLESSFARARSAGHALWRRVASRLDGHHGPGYALIDIDTARAYGIIPLAVESASRGVGSTHPHSAARTR